MSREPGSVNDSNKISATVTGDRLVLSHSVSGDSFHAHSGVREFTYTATVESASVDKFYNVMGITPGDQQGLFQALAVNAKRLESIDEIVKLLKDNGIEYTYGDTPEINWI